MATPPIKSRRKRLLPFPQLQKPEGSQPLGQQSNGKKRSLQKLPVHMNFLIQALLETNGNIGAAGQKEFFSNGQSNYVHKIGGKDAAGREKEMKDMERKLPDWEEELAAKEEKLSAREVVAQNPTNSGASGSSATTTTTTDATGTATAFKGPGGCPATKGATK